MYDHELKVLVEMAKNKLKISIGYSRYGNEELRLAINLLRIGAEEVIFNMEKLSGFASLDDLKVHASRHLSVNELIDIKVDDITGDSGWVRVCVKFNKESL